ncbi:membrane-associated phospholipid phosphatase [Massilia sp. H6]|uniref:membrane-associated phospholipid phosphatase n=1 Tax=Massilia sp. H6 TaxID=2970464 RepID=UPI002168976E|nr:membrane-associated phospholipid phosphatase [Massilia sp. H6]UVW30302.1 membrane-associated phospholipid phosphatase [Massilia sp. H6]
MMSWKLIIDIGHTAFALPMAAAIAAWLIVGRSWKLAMYWCLMFGGGLVLVALSKIAFLGWAVEIPALQFNALSGHALCASAVVPVLFFVALQGSTDTWRLAGALAGGGVSVGLGVLLVYFNFHTASEVIASLVLGTCISMGYIRIARSLPSPQLNRWAIPLSMLVFALVFSLKPATINHRLVDVALHLSGRDRPFKWPKRVLCGAPGQTAGQGQGMIMSTGESIIA